MESSLLDDPQSINAIDKSDMIDYSVNAAKHYKRAAEIAKAINVDFAKPNNIIIAGLGGSGIGGDLFKDWAKNQLSIPIEISREYHLPVYADNKTLVLITSYSGDTEETLSTFLDALRRECMIYCITSGGAIKKYAERYKVPHFLVPGGMPPRAALPYMLVSLLVLMEKIGVVKGASSELKEAIEIIQKISGDNTIEKRTSINFAKKVAQSIGNTTPIIYGFDFYGSVAQRIKQQFNENSKSVAKWEYFPELDHNEIVGWESGDEYTKRFSVIFLRDNQTHLEIESRIETTKAIIEEAGLKVFDLKAQGRSRLARMISAIVIGDFISVYLAVLRGVDPTPVKSVDILKEALKKNGVKEKIIEELEKL